MTYLTKLNHLKPVNHGFASVWPELFHDDFFNKFLSAGTNPGIPPVNISETTEGFVMAVAVPGLNKEDIKVKLENHLLTVSADKQNENTEENKLFSRIEFSFQKFERSFRLPKTVNQEGITATYSDGILTLRLPKMEEAKEKPVKEISIS